MTESWIETTPYFLVTLIILTENKAIMVNVCHLNVLKSLGVRFIMRALKRSTRHTKEKNGLGRWGGGCFEINSLCCTTEQGEKCLKL